MKEQDFKALDALYMSESDDKWKIASNLAKSSSLNKREMEEGLDELVNKGLAEESESFGGGGYMISTEGKSLAEQRKLGRLTNNLNSAVTSLRYSQEKSSAAETIFTVTLVGFGYIQLLSRSTPISDGLATGMTLLAFSWALVIGGGNLIAVTKRQLSEIKNWLDIH